MKMKSLQTNYTSGELDPRLRARRTIKHWFNGARYMRNVLVRPQGGAHRRPGSAFAAVAPIQVSFVSNEVVDGDQIDNSEATAVSTSFNDEDLLLDGDLINYAVDPSGTSSVFTVDWGASNGKTLSGIVLVEAESVHILGSGTDRAITISVDGSDTGAFGGEEFNIINSSFTGRAGTTTAADPATEYRIPVDVQGIERRFFRITLSWTTAANLYLAEVEYFELGGVDRFGTTAPNGGTTANLTDGDTSTELVTTTNVGTVDPYVIAKITFISAKDILYVDVTGLRLSAAPTGTEGFYDSVRIQYSNDDATWFDFGVPFAAVTTTDLSRRRSAVDGNSVSGRYWRLVKIGDENGGTVKFHIDEMAFFQEVADTVSNVKMIYFERELARHYICMVTDRNVRIFKDGVFVVDVASPIENDEIPEMDYVQRLDTLLLFHHLHQPHKIFREKDDDDWSSVSQAFTNIPQFDFGAGDEDTWSDARGWPRCGTFFQSRLFMANSLERPDTVWASKTADLFDFDLGTGLDDEAIEKTIFADGPVAFHKMYAGRHLYGFGSRAEFYSPQSEDEVITPENFLMRRSTKSGSVVGLGVYEVDGAVLFVQRGGSVIREFIFTDTEAAYQASNVSLLSPHLIRQPVDACLREATTNDDADIYFIANSDGTLATFTTLRDQEISAWSLQETAGDVLACQVDLDTLFLVVQRTINGATVNYLEKWVDGLHMDAGVSGTATGTATITGLDHLEGETVEVIADNVNMGTFVVSGGSVTLPRDIDATYQVGLPFPDVTLDAEIAADPDVTVTGKQVLVMELPVSGELPDGDIAGDKKRVAYASLLLYRTRHIELQGNLVALRKEGSGILDTAVPLFTGERKEKGFLGWTTHGGITLSQSFAGELEILGVKKGVSV